MRRLLAVPALIAALASVPSNAGAVRGSKHRDLTRGSLGIVVTESPAASRVGRAVLESGGNAFDAAAATVFALGVARPQSCGVGGGGFAVVRTASGRTDSLDFREEAPAAFTAQTLQGEGLHKQFTGHLTVGVPGTLAGMDALLKKYGTLTLRQAITPAEQLAEQGFRVPPSLQNATRENLQRIKLFPTTAKLFLDGNGQPIAAGTLLRRPLLAETYRRIQRDGAGALYGGVVGRRIVRDMRAARPQTNDPGLLTLQDLAAYRAKWRGALAGSYRGFQLLTSPPPTSGGIALLELLNIVEPFDLAGQGRENADTIHLVAEAEKLAFADRAKYVADPDVVAQPTARLVSKDYAAQRRALIRLDQAQSFTAGDVSGGENPAGSTTHVSVIDARGNAIALTCTIEQEFGSAVVPPGTGLLLNNELTDFGAPGTANEAGPGKRPRSSISPTIVVRGGKPVLVTGGAGGVRIIMGVVHAVLGVTTFGEPLDLAVDAERWDNQGTGTLELEDGRIPAAVLDDLAARGHQLRGLGEYGVRPRVQVAGVDPVSGQAVGVSDPRTEQAALAQRRSASTKAAKRKG